MNRIYLYYAFDAIRGYSVHSTHTHTSFTFDFTLVRPQSLLEKTTGRAFKSCYNKLGFYLSDVR